jgi:UDP-N-acetylmuramate dehydrogenase
MKIIENYSLFQHNTFHIDVRAKWFMEYGSEEELKRILRDEYFLEQCYIHIGAGSNLLFLGDYNGVVLHSAICGIEHQPAGDAKDAILRVGAGEIWDNVVAYSVANNLYGIENLSGVPGEAGAAAVQNIGAYGVELSDVIEYVEAYNCHSGVKVRYNADECRYSYRSSRFKEEDVIITCVGLRLKTIPEFNLSYSGLSKAIDGEPSLERVRAAVLNLRGDKLPDPDKTGNAGSFFMNPVVNDSVFNALKSKHPDIPSYPAPNGVKLSAAWLIEQCGYKGVRHGSVGVYEKHSLVLVNFGGATGNDVALLAEEIMAAVNKKFNIELKPEVTYIA